MIRKRSYGTAAALGGMAAGIVMLAGLPSAASADELSDLRANQELLQRRIDQLAQGIPGAGNLYPGDVAKVAGQASLAGSFPRSFLIPGTDTSIKVYGAATLVVDYFLSGAVTNTSPPNSDLGDNGTFQSAPLKIHPGQPGFSATSSAAKDRSNDVFWMTPQESKMGVETRTPTAWGEARTVVEFDFDSANNYVPGGGCPNCVSDSIKPRLRFAYGTLGGWLAGQANSNFSDPDGNAETLDFGGNVGEAGIVRIPQVRYTQPLAPWGLLGAVSVSAEDPETEGVTAFGQFASDAGVVTSPFSVATTTAGVSISPTLPSPTFNPFKAGAPDLTVAWYVPQPWGHWDASAVLRPALQINDGLSVSRTYMGWGVHAGFDVKPGWFGWAKDDILMSATGGIGIGRYMNSSSNVSLQTNYPVLLTPGFNPALDVHVVPIFGGEIGYQHWWLDNLRSDINFGIEHQDLRSNFAGTPAFGTGSLNKELTTAHVNLIWNPVSFVTVGIEYFWGHRIVVNNEKGDENAIIGKSVVSF